MAFSLPTRLGFGFCQGCVLYIRVTHALAFPIHALTVRRDILCRLRNFIAYPCWEMPPYILKTPIVAPEGDGHIPSPVLTQFKICGCRSRSPFAAYASFSRGMHAWFIYFLLASVGWGYLL